MNEGRGTVTLGHCTVECCEVGALLLVWASGRVRVLVLPCSALAATYPLADTPNPKLRRSCRESVYFLQLAKSHSASVLRLQGGVEVV